LAFLVLQYKQSIFCPVWWFHAYDPSYLVGREIRRIEVQGQPRQKVSETLPPPPRPTPSPAISQKWWYTSEISATWEALGRIGSEACLGQINT
jgi:hypothetical protein